MGGGFGGMLAFEVKGGLAAGQRLIERVRVITLAVSLGGVESLITHVRLAPPASPPVPHPFEACEHDARTRSAREATCKRHQRRTHSALGGRGKCGRPHRRPHTST